MESRTISGIEHFVYDSLEEFENHQMGLYGVVPPIAEDWRWARKGDWVWSTDTLQPKSKYSYNRIVQILRWNPLKNACPKDVKYEARGYIGTVVGTFRQGMSPSRIMDTDFSRRKTNIDRYLFWPDGLTDSERKRKRRKLTTRERYFVVRVATGIDPVEAYAEVFSIKGMTPKKVRDKTLFLLKQERIMSGITEGTIKAAKSKGVDPEWIFEKFKEFIEKANSENLKLEAIKYVGELLDIKPEVIKPTGLLGAGVFGNRLNRAQIQAAEIDEFE